MRKSRLFGAILLIYAGGSIGAHCSTTTAGPAAGSTRVCPRCGPGSTLAEPRNLFSSNGILRVNFVFQTRADDSGNTLYCFMTDNGLQSPTLHVRPGEELLITLKNDLPSSTEPAFQKGPAHAMSGMPEMEASAGPGNCTGMVIRHLDHGRQGWEKRDSLSVFGLR